MDVFVHFGYEVVERESFPVSPMKHLAFQSSEHPCLTSIVIRELGYPDRKMLPKWVREFEKEGRLHEKPRAGNAYALEEKRRAVDFYLEHGRQISYTLRILGYPSRQKLMEWIDELAPGERIIHEGHLKREKYPAMNRKADCVMKLAARSGSAEEAAMEAGVSRSSLYAWKKELAYDIDISYGLSLQPSVT